MCPKKFQFHFEDKYWLNAVYEYTVPILTDFNDFPMKKVPLNSNIFGDTSLVFQSELPLLLKDNHFEEFSDFQA